MTPEIKKYLSIRGKRAAKARWEGIGAEERGRIMRAVRKGKKLSTGAKR